MPSFRSRALVRIRSAMANSAIPCPPLFLKTVMSASLCRPAFCPMTISRSSAIAFHEQLSGLHLFVNIALLVLNRQLARGDADDRGAPQGFVVKLASLLWL